VTEADLQGKNAVVVNRLADLEQAYKKVNLHETLLQAQLDALVAEAAQIRKRNDALEDERVRLVVAKENAEKERQAFDNIAKQATSDKALAAAKVASLTIALNELKSTGGSAGATVRRSFDKPPAALPEGVRGTVTAYRDGYVELSIGIDAGLSIGAVLDVFRTEGKGQYLGTVTIERVYPKEAVAKFKPSDPLRTINKLRPEELPKVGDIVGRIGSLGAVSMKP